MEKYPVLLMPNNIMSLGADFDATDQMVIDFLIIAHDIEGNEHCFYSGLCNVKFEERYDLSTSDVDENGQAPDSLDNKNEAVESQGENDALEHLVSWDIQEMTVENEVIVETTPTTQKMYECEKHTKPLDQITAVKQHMVGNHKRTISTIEKDSAPELEFTCSDCDKEFESENSCMLTSKGGIILKNSSTQTDASEDFNQTILDENENANFVIAKVMANKAFMTSSRKLGRCKEFTKICTVCSKSFRRIKDLKIHLIDHVFRSTLAKRTVNKDGTLTIKCEICQRETFSETVKYRAHLREHAKLTLYICTICDKSFSDSSNFCKHKKIHGPTLFQCDLCQRKFSSKEMIARHMQYHNDNTPVSCSICDKKFHFSSTLRKHMISAHKREELKHRCRFCEEYFKSKAKKWDHERRVHNARKKAIYCPICKTKFRFYSYADLKIHCTSAHDIDI